MIFVVITVAESEPEPLRRRFGASAHPRSDGYVQVIPTLGGTFHGQQESAQRVVLSD